MTLRLATVDDATEIAEIYEPFVRETATSFEATPPGPGEIARRIGETLPRYPWLVADEESRVVGYAYAGSHRQRAAYRWSVEPSVYLAPQARGRGLGRQLYGALLALLRAQRFANAYAGITLPNDPSLRLHESMGFEPIGIYRRVGYKFGRWHDVWWGVLDLDPERDGEPDEPRSLDQITAGELETIIGRLG